MLNITGLMEKYIGKTKVGMACIKSWKFYREW